MTLEKKFIYISLNCRQKGIQVKSSQDEQLHFRPKKLNSMLGKSPSSKTDPGRNRRGIVAAKKVQIQLDPFEQGRSRLSGSQQKLWLLDFVSESQRRIFGQLESAIDVLQSGP